MQAIWSKGEEGKLLEFIKLRISTVSGRLDNCYKTYEKELEEYSKLPILRKFMQVKPVEYPDSFSCSYDLAWSRHYLRRELKYLENLHNKVLSAFTNGAESIILSEEEIDLLC